MGAYVKLEGSLKRDDFLKLFKKCKDVRLRERYQAMYLSFMYGWKEIAEILGRDYGTVLEWVELYNSYGLEGLKMDKPPGRPPDLSDEQTAELKGTVQMHPRILGLPFSNWSLKSIGKWVENRFGISFSKEGVRQVLLRLGFVCVKPSYVFILADKEGQESFVRKLRRRVKLGKTILFGDESVAQQHPTLSPMWTLKGIRPSIPTLGNHKKQKVFGVVNPFSGNSLCRIAPKLSADEFIAFLNEIKVQYKRHKVVLCLDNFQTHKSRKVKEYLRTNRWLEVLYLPVYSPQFNPIEQLWRIMKYAVSHNTFYSRIGELGSSILEFFEGLKGNRALVRSVCSVGYLVD